MLKGQLPEPSTYHQYLYSAFSLYQNQFFQLSLSENDHPYPSLCQEENLLSCLEENLLYEGEEETETWVGFRVLNAEECEQRS